MNFLKKKSNITLCNSIYVSNSRIFKLHNKNHNVSDILQTTTKAEELAGTENIGDARLVNSQVNETNRRK